MDRTVFESRLIEELQKHPNLYTKRSQLDFHDYNTIEQSWNLVSKRLNSDTKSCKKIWRNLRDSYVRQLKKINTCLETGSDPSHFTKWKHFEKMSFLKSVISHRSLTDPKSLDQLSFFSKTSLQDEQRSINDHNSFLGKVEGETNSISSDPVSEKDLNYQMEPNMLLKSSPTYDEDSPNPTQPNNNTHNHNHNHSLALHSSRNNDIVINSFLSNAKSSTSTSNNNNNNNNSKNNNNNINSNINNSNSNSNNNNNNNNNSHINFPTTSHLRSAFANEESFGQHVAKSLENLSALRRSMAKVKIQEILSEFEQEDAHDPMFFMPNIFLNSTFPKL